MSCNSCFKKFGIFRSEYGCPSCGFAFCNNCLSNKIFVKKINKEAKVCGKCKMADDQGNTAGPSNPEPPKAYLRRLETLDNPSKPPITVYQNNDRLQRLKRGLSQPDVEIAERLEKLREDRKGGALPTDGDIRERLDKLKGQPAAISTMSNVPVVDIRTDEEKSADLMRQYMQECQLEETRSAVDRDIQDRLDQLADRPAGAGRAEQMDFTSREMTEEEEAQELVKKITSQMDDDDDLSVDSAPEKDSDEMLTDDSSAESKSTDSDRPSKKR